MKHTEPGGWLTGYHLVFSLFLLFAVHVCRAGDFAVTIEVGVNSWLHLAVKDGNLCFLGNPKDVSKHSDLKRWTDYCHPSPLARVTMNGHSAKWDMKEPLPLGTLIDGATVGIEKVELMASGRPEVSMHPNTENMGRRPPKDKKRNCVIGWNRQELRLWDDAVGASPYVLRVILSTSPRPDSRKAWINEKHKLLHPCRQVAPIALEELILDRSFSITRLYRDYFPELIIGREKIAFKFQDEYRLYAQYFGKSKNRLVNDRLTLLGEPVLEVAACFAPAGDLRCMDSIMYSGAESIPLSSELFFILNNRLLNRLCARLGPPEVNREYGYPVGKKLDQVKWKVLRWSCGDSQVELNTGYLENAGGIRTGRYIFVRIAPPGGCESLQLDTLSRLQSNLSGTPGRRMIIKNIPMVNQGQKGFCVPAVYSMGSLYHGLNLNQYSVHLFLSHGSDIEDYLKTMNIPFRREWYEIGYTAKQGFSPRNPLIEQYNKKADSKYPAVADAETLYKQYDGLKGKLDETLLFSLCSEDTLFIKFKDFIIRYIDLGIPVFWGVHGHSRLIIGYDLDRNEIFYRDTWGINHTRKRMNFCEAFFRTNRCSTVTPLN